MPKEQINYPRVVEVTCASSDGTPNSTEKWEDPLVNVNWRNSPDGTGHVQVSLDLPEKYLRMAVESLNGDLVTGSSLAWSPVLDRHDINRMIRALRRARDAAYGADA